MRAQKLFDTYLEGRHWDQHPLSYARYFSDFLKKNSFDGKLVDIGCGSGRDVAFFSDAGFDTIEIDHSAEEIERARLAYPRCTFEIQDAERSDFSEGEIGAIYIVNVMHYLDQTKALREFLRIVRPGGYVFAHFNLTIRDADGRDEYSQRETEILELVSPFSIIERTISERTDQIPKVHTHTILQLILQKPRQFSA